MKETEEKRIAVLDLGTNTFHLLIAAVTENTITFLFQKTIAVVLGREGLEDQLIHSAAISRAINAISDFKDHIDNYQVREYRALATSAIRDASNGKNLIESAYLATGIRIEAIPGSREAELIYRGVRQAVELAEMSLIMDIGGGSTEFIICNQNEIKWKKSFPIGAARLMEKFMHSDPVSKTDHQAMIDFMKPALSELQLQVQIFRPRMLIGSAGSFETFCSLADPDYISYETWEGAIPEQFNTNDKSYLINLNEFSRASNQLMASTHQDRLQMAQIPEVRKDMIITALIQLNAVKDMFNPSELWLSVYSLKEGILFDWLD